MVVNSKECTNKAYNTMMKLYKKQLMKSNILQLILVELRLQLLSLILWKMIKKWRNIKEMLSYSQMAKLVTLKKLFKFWNKWNKRMLLLLIWLVLEMESLLIWLEEVQLKEEDSIYSLWKTRKCKNKSFICYRVWLDVK